MSPFSRHFATLIFLEGRVGFSPMKCTLNNHGLFWVFRCWLRLLLMTFTKQPSYLVGISEPIIFTWVNSAEDFQKLRSPLFACCSGATNFNSKDGTTKTLGKHLRRCVVFFHTANWVMLKTEVVYMKTGTYHVQQTKAHTKRVVVTTSNVYKSLILVGWLMGTLGSFYINQALFHNSETTKGRNMIQRTIISFESS